jgi:hypothetical protein
MVTGGAPPVDPDLMPSEPARSPPHPANVPGPFYVEDGCCIACGVWEAEAPGLLAWVPDSELPHCYVARQPESDAEFEQMMAAMRVSDVDCIRVHNCKPDWERRLRKAGLGWQIDPENGPATE